MQGGKAGSGGGIVRKARENYEGNAHQQAKVNLQRIASVTCSGTGQEHFHCTLIVKRLNELHMTNVSLRCVVEARAQPALERMGRHAAGSALEDAAKDASS